MNGLVDKMQIVDIYKSAQQEKEGEEGSENRRQGRDMQGN